MRAYCLACKRNVKAEVYVDMPPQCELCGSIFLEPIWGIETVRDGSPLETQEGGDHYKSMKIQPVEYIHANGIGYCEGAVIKYVSRWRNKNGLEDLRKAKHFIDLLIELESGHDQDTA